MSDIPGTSSAPTDDFIHVSMEKSNTSVLSDSFSSKSPYSQVVFHDLSEVYPTDGDIKFSYSVQPGIIPQVGDRVALYKVGWSSVSEFITAVFVNPPDDSLSQNKYNKITFGVEKLPKDEINMYQFCYITSGNVVAGSSIPFTFRKPLGNELVAVEDPNDSGLVVFRSRVTQLQEQLEKSNSVKEELEKTITELKSELYLIKSQLNENIKNYELQKENVTEMTTLIYNLNSEKKELLKKLETTNELTNQVSKLELSLKEISLNMTMQQEEIEMYKKEIASKDASIISLKEEIGILEDTVNLLNNSISSKEEDSKSTIQALQTQLQQANDTISHFKSNMNIMETNFEQKLTALKHKYEANKKVYEETVSSLKAQIAQSKESLDCLNTVINDNEEKNEIKCEVLICKLKESTEKNNSFLAENFSLTQEVEALKKEIKTMGDLVKSKNEKMNTLLNSSDENSRLIILEDENSLLQVQLISLEERLQSYENSNQKLKEEKIQMSEQLSKMNEELHRIKHNNPHSNNTQKPTCSENKGTPGSSSKSKEQKGPFPFPQFSQFIPFFPFQGAGVNVSASFGGESSPTTPTHPICEKCLELDNKVRSLMQEKSDIRSDLIQTKHASEENCKHLKEANEEAAALRSRIAVLEIELRKAKEILITCQGEQKYKEMIGALSVSSKKDDPMQISFDSLKMEPSEKQKLEESLLKEIETRTLLQRNVEALMLADAKNFAIIDRLKKENAVLTTENNLLKGEKKQVVDTLGKMEQLKNEKTKLEAQLIELRKESVGKVSLNTVQQLREENEQLKKQLVDKECSNKQKEKLDKGEGSNRGQLSQQSQPSLNIDSWVSPPSFEEEKSDTGFSCPVCDLAFPPGSIDAYNKHFSDHFD